MENNRVFYYALMLSLFIHSTVVIVFSLARLDLLRKPLKQIEVVYQKQEKKKAAKKKKKYKPLKVVKQDSADAAAKSVKIAEKKQDIFKQINRNIRDISKLTGNFRLDKKPAPRIKPAESDRKIKIPMLKSEKITNFKYLSYNQTIRERIRDRAYAYADHPDFQSGEVYLTFVLDANGTLLGIKVIEEKTNANQYLQDIGMQCIQDSSPFPAFPGDLQYPELTFNVVISFQVDK